MTAPIPADLVEFLRRHAVRPELWPLVQHHVQYFRHNLPSYGFPDKLKDAEAWFSVQRLRLAEHSAERRDMDCKLLAVVYVQELLRRETADLRFFDKRSS